MIVLGRTASAIVIFLILLLLNSSSSSSNSALQNPLANLPTTWTCNPKDPPNFQPILIRRPPISGPQFAAGFYCKSDGPACIFAVVIFQNRNNSDGIDFPELIWSANRNTPVKSSSTLELNQLGDLILTDGDGSPVWSTDTAGKSVSGMNLTELGNLVLFDRENRSVWQSVEHLTDALVPDQKLVSGSRLISSVSSIDWGEGQYSFEIKDQKMVAYIGSGSGSDPPQYYYESVHNVTMNFVELRNGSFGEFIFRAASGVQFVRLDPDGHLKVYQWNGTNWVEEADLFEPFIPLCGYPMVCGKYGICSGDQQCSCPGPEATRGNEDYFIQTVYRHPDQGCSPVTAITCEHSNHHTLFELKNIDYFGFKSVEFNQESDLEVCKTNCLTKCSCKAALFRSHGGSSLGNCLMLDEIYSLKDDSNPTGFGNVSTTAFVKVQTAPKRNVRWIIIVAGSVAGFVGICLVIGTVVFVRRKKNVGNFVEEDYLDQLPGMPTRYAYEDLKTITENFSIKLGEGGFGSVYKGTLGNGAKVAVKYLQGVALLKKSFLAEVETIGNIHHVNLVRLIGFCAENSYRLLVYEYMCHGSLNEWIFPKNRVVSLKWKTRKKIVLQIAKGLAYLHEECRQKILHLDIKPQNILLDENYNAKVSDFGLSKLIDKDQSQVVTMMRGTPGYLAPEWLSSAITEKVDVYSFGVVLLEILCGRRNLDRSRPDGDMHLLSLFKSKAEEDRLGEIVDEYSEDMESHGSEVTEMMRVAAWCLQSDFSRRPSMSMVVKALDGVVDVEQNLDYNFMNTTPIVVVDDIREDTVGASTPLLPSLLSGPR